MPTLFITCPPFLEPLLKQELIELGYTHVREGYRGVFAAVKNFDSIYEINYLSRIAGRVLMPLLEFPCKDRASLYQNVCRISWKSYFAKAKSFAVDAHVDPQVFKNSLFAAQVVKDAVCDVLREETGGRPDVKPYDPDIQLNLFLQNGKAVLSFDTSGIPLHKRGYRQEGGEAPLQENLAAALLKIAQFRGDEIFYDPCCGSGTLLIEAALIATATPPQFLRRRFGFMHLPEYAEISWLKFKNLADSKRKDLPKGQFFGADINRNAIRICQANLRACGLMRSIEVFQGDFRDLQLQKKPNFIITNPPYGSRLDSDPSLIGLYRALGDLMKQKTDKPARGFVFTGNMDLSKEVGLAPKRRYVLENGGIESRLLEFDLY